MLDIRAGLASFILAISLSAALAGNDAVSPPLETDLAPEDELTCANAISTVEIVECSDQERRYWDGRLNEAYKTLVSKLDRKQAVEIRDIQRKWIAFRDAICPFEVETGTVRQIMVANCFAAMTEVRAKEIEDLLERVEAD